MKKSSELKQLRASKMEAQKQLVEKAKAENRELTAEEVQSFDALQTEISDLATQVERALAFEENQRTLAGASAGNGEEKEKQKMRGMLNIGKAIREAGTANLTGVEKEINEIALAEMRAAGKDVGATTFNIPSSMVRAAAHTVTEDSGANGGALVVDQTPQVVPSFIPKLFLEELGATMLTGLSGGNLPLPVASNFNFQWAAETATINAQKSNIAGPKLAPKRAGAVVLISNRLIMQSSLDVQSLVFNMLREGAARALNGAAINGAGGVAPTGLLNMNGILASAQVAPGAADWAKVLELQGLIEQNDSTTLRTGYLLNPILMAKLRATTKDSGSGLFLADGNLVAGQNTVATSLVPNIPAVVDPATPQLHHLIYGDFSQMFIGQWGGISFVVDAISAQDSNSVKVTVNMEADVQVANKKAFAVNSFLTV